MAEKTTALVLKSIINNKNIVKSGPAMLLFLLQYMGKFKIINVGGEAVIHSHLPTLGSHAYTQFVDNHLLDTTEKPSHAQIAITNHCPHSCDFCYNKNHDGIALQTEDIIATVAELSDMGVFWLGLTGGEPLLNKDLEKIISSIPETTVPKLFTTGIGLDEARARSLRDAGLFYVSISLDHWDEAIHDKSRGTKGAFRSALKAIELFKRSGMHVSVSSVLSKEMIANGEVEKLLDFLIELEVHEAWFSEAKPTSEEYWSEEFIITADEQQQLIALQDSYNSRRDITVNYLGHFESDDHFGCNAGSKMIYIDAFGEVSPCVFIPMSFGNVKQDSLRDIYDEMKDRFCPEGSCFINKNYDLFKKRAGESFPLNKEASLKLLEEVSFDEPARFAKLQRRGEGHASV